MVGRRHTVSHSRRRTGTGANPDHRNHRHCFLPIQNPFQQQHHHQLQKHTSNPGSPSSTSAMTAMTDSTLTMIEPCSTGVAGPSAQTSLTVNNSTTTTFATCTSSGGIHRDNSLRLKPCLSFGATAASGAFAETGPGHKAPSVGLEMVTMRTPQRKGSFQVLLKKDSVRSRSSFIQEL